MIRLLAKDRFTINSIVHKCLLRQPPLYRFSQKKPNQKQNEKNKKPKIRFGINHPFNSILKRAVNQNIKALFDKKNKFENAEKQKQQTHNTKNQSQNKSQQTKNQQNKQKIQNSNSLKLKSFIAFLIFFYIFSPSAQQRPKKYSQKNNLDFLLNQIAKTEQNTKINVQRKGMYQIQLVANIGTTKKYLLKVNQNQLIYFLQSVEKIKNGTTEVNFINNYIPIPVNSQNIQRILNLTIIAMIAYGCFYIFRKMRQNPMNMNLGNILNQKKFQPVKPENIKIHFQDVAGMHEAKAQITQFVDFLKKPDKYIQMGAKVPKGALLTGPPGTGKTLLAKACAGQAGVPFFSVSGSDFVEKYSGLGASRVRSLFDQAQKNAPSIIFIDQIDAIGKKRDAGPFSNQQRDNTLNQLLVRMDGFDTKNKVIVMAATNRKDMLDPALLRPGRFDRSVQIGLPSLQQRAQILKVHLKKVKFDTSLTIEELAKKISRLTPGFSGAQLANTCNQAAILAARDKLEQIPLQKFYKATERVMAGLEKRNLFSQQQKQMLAFYQAGKAVANWFTQGADPVIKISILPFSKSKAGYSHNIKDQTALHTKDELLAKVCCYLAGRCSEKYFKGYISTNGNNDLERAKKIIAMIVTKFGMTQSLKMYAFPDFDFTRKPYSEKVEALIDQQISKLTVECQKKIQQIIKSKQQQIMKVKQKLLEKQTLTHNDIKQILGERPFGGNQNYQQFLKDQQQQQQRIPQGPRTGVASG